MFDTATTPVDTLEQELLACESDKARLVSRQIDLLRRLDLAQVAAADGCRTMVDWVSSRLDVSHPVARDLLLVARAVDPEVDRLLEAGEIGLERAVGLVRLRQTGPSDQLVSDSFRWDLAGLLRLVADRLRLTSAQEQKAFSDRFLVMQPSLDESWWNLWGGLSGPDGQAVEKALLTRADQFPRLEGEGRSQKMADALTSLALDSLTGGSEDSPGRDITVAEVFIDAELTATTAGEAGVRLSSGPKVGPNVLSEILCTGQVRVMVTDSHGTPLDYTHLGEAVPPAIRAAVWRRDQGVCAIDGCRSRYRLQPHHIVERSAGGNHHPSNLTLLCWYHHHIAIHGLGFRIDALSPPQRRRLHRQPPSPAPPVLPPTSAVPASRGEKSHSPPR